MKKIIIASLIGIVAIGILSSCNKSRTYAQRLGDEQKVIEQFIDRNDITVLREYPKDSVFKEKEFYFDSSSGVYYNVIYSGNGEKIIKGENVAIRYKDLEYLSGNDTVKYSNIFSQYPEELTYGNTSTYTSAAWAVPIKNVSYYAKVKMIVPFSMGLSSDNQAYRTAYYEELEYKYSHGVTVVK